MCFNGAINQLGYEIGVVLISPIGSLILTVTRLHFLCTNNIAKYEACTIYLKAAIDLDIDELEVYEDSALVIFQAIGNWFIREKFLDYHECLQILSKSFEYLTFNYTSGRRNSFTNAQATLASMIDIPQGVDMTPIKIRQRNESTYCLHHVLLRCVDEVEASTIIEDIYRGECDPHMNWLMLAKKILRLDYYQSTMETDFCQHVMKCHTCQSYANIIKAPASEYHNLTTPWPFSMWGINVVGPMPQKAANGHLYIILAINYFTKWVEVISLSVVIMKNTSRFIRKDIIC